MSNMIYVPNEVMTVVVDNVPYVVAAAHPNFNAVVQAAKEGRFQDIPALTHIARSIKAYGQGKIEVDEENSIVMYNGEELHNYATTQLLTMMREGFDVNPLVNFLTNLLLNPSKRAVDELYGFLEYGKMPITPDGHFLAYKRVRDDFKSVHDGKTDNSVGKVVEMERNKVDDNSHQTCSQGLHFCSLEYLRSYSGQKIVILKINPRDVVSIPVDYNNTKGRACQYEVVDVLSEDQFRRALEGMGAFDTSVIREYDDEEDADVFEEDDVFHDADDDARLKAYEDTLRADVNNDYEASFAKQMIKVLERENNEIDLEDVVPAHGDDIDWDTPLKFMDGDEIEVNLAFEEGYQEGYADGRAKKASDKWVPSYAQDYREGYTEGYKDGKGHKAKRFK